MTHYTTVWSSVHWFPCTKPPRKENQVSLGPKLSCILQLHMGSKQSYIMTASCKLLKCESNFILNSFIIRLLPALVLYEKCICAHYFQYSYVLGSADGGHVDSFLWVLARLLSRCWTDKLQCMHRPFFYYYWWHCWPSNNASLGNIFFSSFSFWGVTLVKSHNMYMGCSVEFAVCSDSIWLLSFRFCFGGS